ncbi:PadR family transcriptional regulator [Streptomyces sp. FH025]|uniref:PadR family transcriptional regulator n=1 Tax=Streptomyces sp. FH025 TaxID=2815937 RepID=UPI001A9E50BC|nr:PadR family transcriptional regulator [Streptomyces sp. FH025]MBO1420180.1 PadR family transcriptional regulator [Streptomyces sp. FH025]
MQLEYMILGMLCLRRITGYDLRRWMVEGPGRFLGYGVQLPQIYRTLGKMVDRGLVAFDVDPREGRPDAKIYRITEQGHEALLDWARSPYTPSPRPGDLDFTLRFIFAGQLDREIAIDVVRTELEYRERNVSTNGSLDIPDSYEAQVPGLDPVWAREVQLLAHEQGFAATASYIAWLKLTLRRLEAGRQPGRG